MTHDEENAGNPKDRASRHKPRLSLVPASVIIRLAVAFGEGADKYGVYNWREEPVEALVYCDAALRHLLAYIDGEDIDPESGKHHLDGAGASIAILTDARECNTLIDNRPKKGVAADLIRDVSTIKTETNSHDPIDSNNQEEKVTPFRVLLPGQKFPLYAFAEGYSASQNIVDSNTPPTCTCTVCKRILTKLE